MWSEAFLVWPLLALAHGRKGNEQGALRCGLRVMTGLGGATTRRTTTGPAARARADRDRGWSTPLVRLSAPEYRNTRETYPQTW